MTAVITAPSNHILVVEDDPRISSVIWEILQREGYQVLATTCGEQAIAVAAQVRPDLVLLDMMLPDMPGEVVGRAVRILQGEDVPIVVMSALPDIGERAGLIKANARIAKPFTMQSLLRAVRSFTSGSERQRTEQVEVGDSLPTSQK